MTEEELNMQRENRDYIKESQDFLNETVSITAQIADQIQFQVNSIREKMNLDNDVLKISRENYKAISTLKTDYQDLKVLAKDREKIENQIQKNLTVAGAYSQKLQKGEKEAAKSYLLKEASLKSQQDTLAQTISKAEALEDAIKVDEAIGKNTDELYKQLIAQEEQKTLQQGSIGDLTSIINKEQQKLSPQAISAALLEEQNEQLKQSLKYLDEEEDAINRINSAQILFNATFGAVGGLLDKMGMSPVAEIMGIKEGKEAAAAMADKLTEGGEESLGVFGKLRVLVAGMAPMLKKMVFALPIGIFNFMVKKFKEGDELLKKLSAHTKTLAKGLGMSTKSAKHLEHEFASIAGKTGQMPEAIAETTSKMMNLVGTTKNFGKEQVSFFNQLVENGGYSVENATSLLKISEMQGKSTKELTSDYTTQVLALNNQRDSSVSVKSVMEGIANTSARVRANLRDQGKSLATAAFEAKRMGLELDRVNEIGKSSLDFESSLTKELEAELMLGKDLNLEKMRSAALRGDDVTVAEELNRLVRENGDDLKGNILGQEAFASAVGISVDEYANIREQQELLKSGGFKDMNEAQEKYNKLIESGMSIEEAKAKMGNDALGDQLASVSYAQRLEQQERRKQAQAAKFAKSMQPLVKMFREIAEKWSKLLLDNVGRLVPVVNAVGKLFSKIVLKVIGGAGDMSATIGDKLGFVSDYLVGIIDKWSAMVDDGGIEKFFESVKDTAKGIWKAIQPVIEFFKSKTGMSVLAGIGGVIGIQKVGESVGLDPLKMAKEVGGGVFNTLKTKLFPKLGVLGSSAAKPMFVQDIGGGGGGMQDQMMDMISGKMGGRKAGIGGGFKKGFKGLMSYAKMAFKGGRAGKVGRARIGRAAMGMLTGKGGSFVGGASKAASGAGKVAGIAGKVGKLASFGKLAAGGAGAIVGMAAEAAFSHFAGKARDAASALGDQIYASEDATEIAGLEAKQKKKLMQADGLAAAGTVVKYTAMGASIGSMIPVVGTAVGAIVGFVAGATIATINYKRDQKFRSTQAYKDQEMRQRRAAKMQKDEEKITMMGAHVRMDAEMRGAKLTLAMTQKFGDTSNMTGERLKELAAESLAAGNITKDQYTEAIKGTISPLDLLNISTQNASAALTQAAEASIALAEAAGDEAKAKSLAAAGTSEAMIAAQMSVINMAGTQVGSMAADLASKYGDSLSNTFGDVQAKDLLTGGGGSEGQAAAAAMQQMLQEKLGSAATPEQIEAAMLSVGDQMAGDGDKMDINDAAGMETVLSKIVAEIGTKTQGALLDAQNAGNQALIKELNDAASKDAAAEVMTELADVSKAATAAVEAAEKSGTTSATDLQALQATAASALVAIEVAATEEAEAARFRSKELGGGGETKAASPAPDNTEIVESVEGIGGAFSIVGEKASLVFEKVSERLGQLKDFLQPLLDIVTNLFANIFGNIKDFAMGAFENIKNLFVDMWGGAFDVVLNLLDGNFAGAWESLKTVLMSIPNFVMAQFMNLLKFIGGLVSSVGGYFKDLGSLLLTNLWGAIKKLGPFLLKSFKSAWKKVSKLFKSGIGKIKDFFMSIPSAIRDKFNSIVDGIKEKFTTTFSSIKEAIAEKFADFKEFFTLGNLQEKFTTAFTKVKTKIKSIFVSIGETIVNTLKSPINGIIGMINKLLDMISSFTTFTIPGGPLGAWDPIDVTGIDLGQIPLLAKGGITTAPTLAVIGEAGPEAIIPLDKLSSTIPLDNSNSTVSNEPLPQSNDELKKELQELKAIMTGFVNQMAQVVDRPITIELDGNKVGQALGQNSYRMQ